MDIAPRLRASKSPAMGSTVLAPCVRILLATLTVVVSLAPATAAQETTDRPLGHRFMLGLGPTWTEPGRFRHTIYPGASLGFHLPLGKYAAIGILGDFTYIDERPQGPPPTSTNHRMIIGLDAKLLPIQDGWVRPFLTAGLAGSVVHDTGFGWGIGAGAFFLPSTPMAFFVDLRRYHFADFENPSFDQSVLRTGLAF